MRIAFFEDSAALDFSPIALMRPVFELVCGQFSQRERIIRCLNVTQWAAFLRSELCETYRESQPDSHVNDFSWLAGDRTLLINGRWLPDAATLQSLEQTLQDEVGVAEDGTVAYLWLDPLEAPLLTEETWDDAIAQIARTRQPVEVTGTLLRRPWDLVNRNGNQLIADFQLRRSGFGQSGSSQQPGFSPTLPAEQQTAILGNPADVFIDPTADIDPFVVIDARHGPVSIDAGARIQSFTRLEGPCHVSRGSQLFRANIREGTTIGPVCRVGGEVEESILHGYANKYHDGFLGHAYVCPWVNLGALTTNSDLKNDYSAVRVPINGQMVETGSTKVGCFIGDHTKTALASMFNTGSNIGIFCMVLPGGELLPKHIPSFSRIWHGQLDDGIEVEQTFESARTALERRNREFTPAQERLVQQLFANTQAERDYALVRHRKKVAQLQSASVTKP